MTSFTIAAMPVQDTVQATCVHQVGEPRIETSRLILRPFRLDDFEAYAAYHVRPDTYRFLYAASPDRSALMRQYTADMRPVFAAQGDVYKLAVVSKQTEQVVGEVLLRFTNDRALQGEVGYVFNSAFAGKGYATEATQAMVDYGFDHFGLHRIFARIDANNSGSIRVIERLNFRREAHLVQNDVFNGIWGDEFVYAMLVHEWPHKRPTLNARIEEAVASS